MLYLIQPPNGMWWCEMPASIAIEVARESGYDLARLDWRPSERQADDNLVRLAVRHGVTCRGGLVLVAGLVEEQRWAAAIRGSHRAADRAHEKLKPHDEMMERLFPGWIEHRRVLDERVAESSERAATEAEEDAARRLDTVPDPDLVRHWQSLGGILPTLP